MVSSIVTKENLLGASTSMRLGEYEGFLFPVSRTRIFLTDTNYEDICRHRPAAHEIPGEVCHRVFRVRVLNETVVVLFR